MKIGFSLHNIRLKHELTMNVKQSLSKSMILHIFCLTIFHIFCTLGQCSPSFLRACVRLWVCTLLFLPFFLLRTTHSLNHFTMVQFVRRMESFFLLSVLLLNGIYIWYSTFVDTKESDLPNAFRFNYCHLIKWNSTTLTQFSIRTFGSKQITFQLPNVYICVVWY